MHKDAPQEHIITVILVVLVWGKDHESQAKEEYKGCSVEECGLHVSIVKGYLGTSTDGLVCRALKFLL